MKYLNLEMPLVLAVAAMLPTAALAAEPDPECMTNVNLPAPTAWPAWARPGETAAEDFEIAGGSKRTNIWNSFGEFQTFTPEYVHTGIDINATYTAAGGDFAVVAQDGHIFGTHTYNQVNCLSDNNCKLYIRTNDYRYIYYYAHLELRTDDKNDMTPDVDSEIRGKIQTAVGFGNGHLDETEYDKTEVQAEQVISAIAPFDFTRPHLHFSINDACEHFDGLNPLDWLEGAAHPGYQDQDKPEIDGLFLVGAGDNELLSHVDDHCQTVAADFDVVAKLRDVWDEDAPLVSGNLHLGTRETKYRIFNMSTQSSVLSNIWYTFDMIPFRCIGEARGKDCMESFDIDDYIDEVNLFIANPPTVGLFLADTFADIIYRVTGNFESFSLDPSGTPRYFLNLNNEWGVDDGLISLPADSHYQVSVETFDAAGNGRARSLFFGVGAPDPLTDLVIRDNLEDSGAIPSTLGGEKHYRSPDIKVFLASEAPTLMDITNDPTAWNWVQTIDVDVGEDYKVFVRVQNNGCEDVSEFEIEVGSTNPSLISTNWATIDTQKSVVLPQPLAPGESTVVEFDWEPTTAGHRCMLAAVTTDGDPLEDIPAPLGDIDFQHPDVDEAASVYVPRDNSLAQRNITVTGSAFQFGNPFGGPIVFGVDFDCNDLPMDLPGASVALRVQSFGPLGTSWASVPHVTTTLNLTNGQYKFTMDRCKVEFPTFTIAANTVVNAWVDVTLPGSATGSWTVDLTAKVNGQARDGISVVHTQ